MMEGFGEVFLARPEYQVISELVQNPDVSPAEAVQNLLRVREVLHQEGGEPSTEIDGTHTWIAMVTVVKIVNLTPAAQQHKLIEFIAHLQRTKIVDPDTGQEPTSVGMKLWTELPYLGVYLRDMYSFTYDPSTLHLFTYILLLFLSFLPSFLSSFLLAVDSTANSAIGVTYRVRPAGRR